MNLSAIIAARHRAVAGFSTEAQSYFDRLDTAGDTTYVDYKQPLANYIDGLVTLGGAYWDTMESAASFVGVGIQGITVPLRDGMPVPTQNNFVASDLSQLTGLKGDGSTKYIDTNLAGTSLAQNDASVSVYITEAQGVGGAAILLGNNPQSVGLYTSPRQWIHGTDTLGASQQFSEDSLYGASRSTSTDMDVRSDRTDYSSAVTSTAPASSTISVFAYGAGLAPTKARLATYHAGFALDLATLEGLQETLITEIAAI